MSSQFYFPKYDGTATYSKFDVIQGDNASSTYDYTYFYSLIDSNHGNTPINPGSITPIVSFTRKDDLATIRFSNSYVFYPGSMIKIAGLTSYPTLNYTGMALNAGPGFISYTSPGNDISSISLGTGTLSYDVSPQWTTGFFFQPTYTTKVDINNNTITSKLGDNYEQRMPAGINSYSKTYNLVFQSRSNKETRAIINFVQNMAGAYPFIMLFPISILENQPNQKYVAPTLSYTNDSYGLNTINVTANRVFDL